MKFASPNSAARSASPAQALPWTWDLLQVAWFLLPLLPGIGTVGFVVVMLVTWQQRWPQLVRDRQLWGWGILGIWLVLSASFAAFPGEAWLGLANLLPFFLLFAALRWLLRSPAQLQRLTWLGLWAALPVIGLGFGQILFHWTTPSFWYTLSGWRLVAGGNPPGRMASTFMYANLLAFYFAIIWTLGLGLVLNLWHDWRQRRHHGRLLLVSTASLVAIAPALLLTHSRNAWLLATISTLAFAIYEGWYWLLLAMAAGTGTFAWAAFLPQWGGQALRPWLPEFIWARLSDDLFPHRFTAELRVTQWQFVWQMARERPWLGWGLRNFSPLYEAQWDFWLGHPHNLYLMLLAETGWPALLGLAWLVSQPLVAAARALTQQPPPERRIIFSYLLAFAGTIAFNCLDVTLFDLRSNLIGWLLLSAIAGSAKTLKSPATASAPPAPAQ